MAFVKKMFKSGNGKDKKAEEPGEISPSMEASDAVLTRDLGCLAAVNGVDEALASQTEALSINDNVEVATFALS